MIYIGTFSKVLFPALRIGYIVVPADLVARFAAVREAMDIFPPTLYQAVLADFLGEGHFGRHLRRMRLLYRERRAALVEALQQEIGAALEVIGDPAGLHLTALFPAGTTGRSRSRPRGRGSGRCRSRPATTASLPPGLILGYGGTSRTEILDGVRRLGRLLAG